MATTCPYCGEQVMRSGLPGHVVLQDDEGHGTFGEVPPDYEEHGISENPLSARNVGGPGGPGGDADDADHPGDDGLVDRVRSLLG